MKTTLQYFSLAALLVLIPNHGHCHDAAKDPAFEVAAITPCKPGTPAPEWEHTGVARFTSPGGRFTARATTVKFLIEWAWGLQPAQHTGGPAWLGTDRYDITAKAEDAGASEVQIRGMVRTLLIERFQLRIHSEQRTIPVLVLGAGKAAAKLTPAKEGETTSLRAAPLTGPEAKPGAFHIVATRFSLAQLSDTFGRQLGHVIVNRTGLDGEYDFAIDLLPEYSQTNPLDPSHLLEVLRDQLGLTVKSDKVPVDVLVVDSAEKVTAEI